jgi:hypothetical protein
MISAACLPQDPTVRPYQITPIRGDPPNYIDRMAPKPGARMTLDVYQDLAELRTTISCIKKCPVVTVAIDQTAIETVPSQIPFEDRIDLEINGVLIDREKRHHIIAIEGGGSFDSIIHWVAWETDLGIGRHVAILWITKPVGRDLAYQWEFEIVP